MGLLHSRAKFLENPEQFATRFRQDQASVEVKEYDFVIVGGGTAGCVLASRLSENPEFTVLLIEAGKSHEGYLFSKMPLGFAKLFLSAADWSFTTSFKHLDDRVIHCPRGKLLGGTRVDYDEWEREGAEGWSYNDLRPYFLKAEQFFPTVSRSDIRSDEHGASGPWKTKGPDPSLINQILIESCVNVGIPINKDFNTPRGTMGAGSWAAFIDSKGHRSSAATAYLTNDVLARRNLFVAVSCRVEKILFEKENNTPRAIGVELRTNRDGPLFRVSARKEVILSAGAYESPHLLMVSGIGPQKELEEKGITVVKDLPAVGKNLVDHVSCGSVVFQTKGVQTLDYLYNPLNALLALVQWYITGKGPTATLVSPGSAFIRSDDPSLPYNTSAGKPIPDLVDLSSGPNAPDLEIMWLPMVILNGGVGKPPSGIQGITVSVISLRPKSLGEINEHDMHIMARGLRLILKIARAKPLSNFTDLQKDKDKKYPFLWPGTADPDTLTEEEFYDFIRRNCSPACHAACTARMGKSEDFSVVNSKLQVHGIQSLRIIDASIFPKQVSGHPCAPIIAIAEKAADVIKTAYSV
ncbi:hypothetical protein Clacol_007951 [Clathrus columnatus]|uniref:Glucose-methanol-choline oxidoreductase N-terminal domain-containing protein n=1 Tax=Clathrus columnatus TaxID=1419009 RepID=A0AAV5AH66_9AGAM|nr:hypothetical protein Clacol_007951 [Clathrus columnatus]